MYVRKTGSGKVSSFISHTAAIVGVGEGVGVPVGEGVAVSSTAVRVPSG